MTANLYLHSSAFHHSKEATECKYNTCWPPRCVSHCPKKTIGRLGSDASRMPPCDRKISPPFRCYRKRKAPATARWSEGCQELGKQSPPATSSLSSSHRGSMAPTASRVSCDTTPPRRGAASRRESHEGSIGARRERLKWNRRTDGRQRKTEPANVEGYHVHTCFEKYQIKACPHFLLERERATQ